MGDEIEANVLTTRRREPMQRPGIEPGSPPWQGGILPLDQRCCISMKFRPCLAIIYYSYKYFG